MAKYMYKSFNCEIKGLALFLNSILKFKIKPSETHATNQSPPLALIPLNPKLGLLNYTIAFIFFFQVTKKERENL